MNWAQLLAKLRMYSSGKQGPSLRTLPYAKNSTPNFQTLPFNPDQNSVHKMLLGQPDSRGLQGILSRGANVYNATSNAAQSGGGDQFGRPSTPGSRYSQFANQNPYAAAINRRLGL